MKKSKPKKPNPCWPKGYSSQTFYDAVGGDKKSVELSIEAFTPMVHMWVKRYIYMCQEDSYEDLVQEGVIGILKAINTFDLDRRTDDGLRYEPSTWVWWKVRAQVQSAVKKMAVSFWKLDYNKSEAIEGEVYPVNLDRNDPPIDIKKLLMEGCGSLDNKRANIVMDRFGLTGGPPLKHGEVAKKYGISKQAANSHISKFVSKIRRKYSCPSDILNDQ